MRKGTPEQIAQKREEIINACEHLYHTMSFREITLKEIGKITSFSRPTIYNYFETKEEIFLALFKREYDLWNNQLAAILDQNGQLTKTQLADKIAQSLAERSLHLMSMLLEKHCPEMSGKEIRDFLYTFFPFMFGIYPYTAVTEKQKVAMEKAGVSYEYYTVYELTYSCLIRLLGQ